MVPNRAKHHNNADAYHPSSAHWHFKVIYLEAIDSMVCPLVKNDLSSLVYIFSDAEQLLLKSINGKDHQHELDNFRKYSEMISTHPHYRQSFQLLVLFVRMEIQLIFIMLNNYQSSFYKWKNVDEKCHYYCENHVTQWCSTGTPERFFSVARRIKTWLRSTMTQRMFNALAIVNSKRSCR